MPARRVPLEERLFRRRQVDPESGCWLWIGNRDKDGYGKMKMRVDRVPRMVHRMAYEHYVGPIPEGLQIDHLCRVTSCFNPAHLEPVTPRENLLRARKTHCPQGHEFAAEGVSYTDYRGYRRCYPCNQAAQRRYRQRKRSA